MGIEAFVSVRDGGTHIPLDYNRVANWLTINSYRQVAFTDLDDVLQKHPNIEPPSRKIPSWLGGWSVFENEQSTIALRSNYIFGSAPQFLIRRNGTGKDVQEEFYGNIIRALEAHESSMPTLNAIFKMLGKAVSIGIAAGVIPIVTYEVARIIAQHVGVSLPNLEEQYLHIGVGGWAIGQLIALNSEAKRIDRGIPDTMALLDSMIKNPHEYSGGNEFYQNVVESTPHTDAFNRPPIALQNSKPQ